MAASYPTSSKSFSTKATTNVIEASHVNDIQDEVTAIETALLTGGLAHNVIPSGTRTLGNSSTFWDKGYLTALILGAETTSGVRLDVNAGVLEVLEGDDSAYGPLKALTLEATSNGVIGGTLGVTGAVTLGDIATQSVIGAGANGVGIGATHASGAIRFYSGGTTERFRITELNELWFGHTVSMSASVGGFTLFMNSSGADAYFRDTGTGAHEKLGFYNANGQVGSISTSGTTTTYATTSDERLKVDRGLASDVAVLRALQIHEFDWKTDGSRDRGLFAQEAYRVSPRGVLVGSDVLDGDGNLKTPWQVDYSKYVPDLIVGWQQHDARIAALEAKLGAA